MTAGARPDSQPGTSVPQGPSRTQPETNNQKELASNLGVQGQMPNNSTKGQASDVISSKLDNSSGSTGSGAAPDNTPGSTIPTGPSANQDATRNQKQFISRLGADDQITDGITKGEASQVISDAKASGATNNANGNSSSNSARSSGAAPDNNPGSQVPTGPSAGQPATTNQKNLIDSLGASDQLNANSTKGDASKTISQAQGSQ